MQNLTIRRATIEDSDEIAALLNEIIAEGGTTAYLTPFTPETMAQKMQKDADQSAWFVACVDDRIMGFQFFQPHPDLPKDASTIATFARIGAVKMGIGSALFKATSQAARDLGYTWINATILEINTGGHTYYASRGFEIWDVNENAALEDGTKCTKISRRFDL